MHHHKVTLKGRLAGITRAPSPEPAPLAPTGPEHQVAPPTPAAPAAPVGEPALVPGLEKRPPATIVAELVRLLATIQTQDRDTLGAVARMSVELGAAVAERLLNSEIAADRQRLDRVVLHALERMPACRFLAVRGHPDDLALLGRQIAEHADLERYREMLHLRPEEALQRGQLKLEADEWFVAWDTPRCLAEMRAALLEETFMDE